MIIRQLSDMLLDTGFLMLGVAIFLILLVASEAGFRIGHWSGRRREHRERELSGIGTVTAGVFALLAFTLGLTISFAQTRYEARRDTVLREANAVGTAWLRTKVVADPERSALLEKLRDYAEVRLAYVVAPNERAEPPLIARTNDLQNEIWDLVVQIASRKETPIVAALETSMNEVFDAATAARFAFDGRTPIYLPYMLMIGAILAIGSLGFQIGIAGQRPLLLLALMLLMWTGGLLLIVDLNRPRIGLVRVDPAPLEWTIAGFGGAPKP